MSVADAAAVNSHGIKTLLANGLSTFPIKGNPVFSNSPKILPKSYLITHLQKIYEALKLVY